MGLLLILGLFPATLVAPGDGGFSWINAPRMHNPTLTSVIVAAIPLQDSELRATWNGHEGPIQLVRGGELWTRTLDGLPPGRATVARISARPAGADGWELHDQLDLQTLRPRHEPVRFALAADTHVWALFTQKSPLGGNGQPFKIFQEVVDNIVDEGDLDFCVVLSDFVMTECGGCAKTPTSLGPTAKGSAADLDDALVRYRMTWGPQMLGRLATRVPVVTMNGDHEGETGFWDAALEPISRTAREATLPAYDEGYLAGPPGTLAYAFETGPVLIVSIDVHSLSERFPTAPEHWHLGQAQHAWLAEVLGASRRPWKIVMAEHLLGGISDPEKLHWKGRGSITATDDGTPSGTFLGEQALVHQTLVATGADLFVTGHDHVMSWGEKDGVAYLIAGRAGGVAHPWASLPWYRDAMDFDGDGTPEFAKPGVGSQVEGHVEIEATDTTLRVDYIRAALGFGLDDLVVASHELGKPR